MNLLRRFHLQPRNHQQTARGRLHNRPDIAAGIVVRDRNGVQPLEQRHVYNVIGGHILVPAGGQGRMDMQIIEDPHIPSAPSSRASS